MMRRARFFFHPLTALGLLMALGAAIWLAFTPALDQYAFLPTGKLSEYAEKADDLAGTMGDETAVTTLHALKNGANVSNGDSANTSDVTLYLCAARYNEVYPIRITDGEPLSPFSLTQGGDGVVLDEGLAFLLFGDRDPLNEEVIVEGKTLRVIGVAKWTRRPGDANEYAAWAPMMRFDDAQCDLMVASMPAKLSDPLLKRFENAARSVFTDTGDAYSLYKERMRSGIIARFVIMCLCVRLLALWIARYKSIGAGFLDQIRRRLKERYASQSLSFIASRLLLMALLTALTIGVMYFLLAFFLEPVRVFVEWVPEKLVSFSSISSRFWELTTWASRPVRFTTPELARVSLAAALLRWGVLCILAGCMLGALGRGKGDSSSR